MADDWMATLARAIGPQVTRMMQDILDLPDEFRPDATATSEIKTVDGHVWSISVEWGGFEGPDTVAEASQ